MLLNLGFGIELKWFGKTFTGLHFFRATLGPEVVLNRKKKNPRIYPNIDQFIVVFSYTVFNHYKKAFEPDFSK